MRQTERTNSLLVRGRGIDHWRARRPTTRAVTQGRAMSTRGNEDTRGRQAVPRAVARQLFVAGYVRSVADGERKVGASASIDHASRDGDVCETCRAASDS